MPTLELPSRMNVANGPLRIFMCSMLLLLASCLAPSTGPETPTPPLPATPTPAMQDLALEQLVEWLRDQAEDWQVPLAPEFSRSGFPLELLEDLDERYSPEEVDYIRTQVADPTGSWPSSKVEGINASVPPGATFMTISEPTEFKGRQLCLLQRFSAVDGKPQLRNATLVSFKLDAGKVVDVERRSLLQVSSVKFEERTKPDTP